MTKLYKNTEQQKGFNTGTVFRKCKHPGCKGAATDETLGYCIKHLLTRSSQGHPVEDLNVVMDTVRIRSRDKNPHSTRNRRRKSPSVHIGDTIRGLDAPRSKDTRFVLHLHRDDQVTYHQSQDPDLEESSDLLDLSCVESKGRRKRCIGPGCFNMGSSDFNGLCCDCYEVLLVKRQQTRSLRTRKSRDGQGCFSGNSDQQDSVHKRYAGGSQNKQNLEDSRKEWYPAPAHSSFKSGSLKIQPGSDLKEQPNLIDFSVPETPNQRPKGTGQTDVCLVDLSSVGENLPDTVDNTTNLIDLSLTETAQCEEKDARKPDVMTGSTYSFEQLACQRKTLCHSDDDDNNRNGTQVSDVTLDLRLPDEVLQNSNNRTHNYGSELQPEMEVFPSEVTKPNEGTKTFSSRSSNLEVHAHSAKKLSPKRENIRTCNHTGNVYPEIKILNTTPGGHMKDTSTPDRSSKEHRQYRIKDVKGSNILKDRKPTQTKTDQNHTDFKRLIADIEEQSKKAAHKCLASDCENFGNSRCMGLCNSCYKTLTST